MTAKACPRGKILINDKCQKPWKKIKDSTVRIVYQHKVTKRRIGAAREDFISGRWWLPVHFSKPNAGHFIAGVDRSQNKERIDANLREYMKIHSSGNVRSG